jgi:uncharacterized metal-binding protein (TIGR02443 family)
MKRRQFIAGAICPRCQQMDRIVVEQSGDQTADDTVRRCVACGFSDTVMPAAGVLPGTRFARPVDDADSAEAQTSTAVRIMERNDSGQTGPAGKSDTAVDKTGKPG